MQVHESSDEVARRGGGHDGGVAIRPERVRGAVEPQDGAGDEQSHRRECRPQGEGSCPRRKEEARPGGGDQHREPQVTVHVDHSVAADPCEHKTSQHPHHQADGTECRRIQDGVGVARGEQNHASGESRGRREGDDPSLAILHGRRVDERGVGQEGDAGGIRIGRQAQGDGRDRGGGGLDRPGPSVGETGADRKPGESNQPRQDGESDLARQAIGEAGRDEPDVQCRCKEQWRGVAEIPAARPDGREDDQGRERDELCRHRRRGRVMRVRPYIKEGSRGEQHRERVPALDVIPRAQAPFPMQDGDRDDDHAGRGARKLQDTAGEQNAGRREQGRGGSLVRPQVRKWGFVAHHRPGGEESSDQQSRCRLGPRWRRVAEGEGGAHTRQDA